MQLFLTRLAKLAYRTFGQELLNKNTTNGKITVNFFSNFFIQVETFKLQRIFSLAAAIKPILVNNFTAIEFL